MTGPIPLAPFPVDIPTLTGPYGVSTLPARHTWPRLYDDWNLWFVESGQVVWEFKDGRSLRGGKDDFLLLPPLTFSQCRTLHMPVRDWYCHFGFRPIPARMPANVPGAGENVRSIIVPLMFSRREAPGVWRAFGELLGGQRSRHAHIRLWRTEYAGIRLVAELAQFAARRGFAVDDPRLLTVVGRPDWRVVEICAQIRKNPTFPWKIQALAQSLGLSAGYLNELCHATLGKSLKAHLGEVRMQAALQLLRSRGPTGPLSLKEICVACGFSSPQFFNRQFKKFYGIPPAMARRQVHVD